MFTDSPWELSPSVWVNGEQLKPWLMSQGWDLMILPPCSRATHVFIHSIRGLPRIFEHCFLPVKRLLQIQFLVPKADIVVVHKTLTAIGSPPILERVLRKRHRRIIFNFDDATNERGLGFLTDRIALADAVWVGNPVLVKYSREICSNVTAIESAVDCEHYLAKTDYRLHEPLRLIWCGNPTNLKHLELLREPLQLLGKKINFIFTILCRKFFSFEDARIHDEHISFSHAGELKALGRADIALMPLEDGPYERAKENYKVKMFLACGLPVVCSPVGMNRKFIVHGSRGFLADSSKDWVDHISSLANNEALRRQFGTKGRTYVERKYSIPVIGSQLTSLFDGVCKELV